LTASHPERTDVGIVIAVTSVAFLPPLAIWKRRIATRVGSRALRADSVLTGIAAALAAGALIGLVLTRSLEWWWVDPAIALLMVPILFREGLGIVRHSKTSRRRTASWEWIVALMLMAMSSILLAAIVYGLIVLL
jgi:divalent metal cation (Fe/Co/Zn/Cd) transporter